MSPELNERQHELAEDSPLFKKKVSRRMMVLTDQVDQTTSTKVVILPGNGEISLISRENGTERAKNRDPSGDKATKRIRKSSQGRF